MSVILKHLAALGLALLLPTAQASTAVVFSESTGRYGVAWNEPDKDAAVKKAIEDCRYRGGGKDCKPLRVTDEKGFGVVAQTCAGTLCSVSVMTGRRSARQAESDAIQDCNSYYGVKDCRAYDNWQEQGAALAQAQASGPLPSPEPARPASKEQVEPIKTNLPSVYQEPINSAPKNNYSRDTNLAEIIAALPKNYLSGPTGIDWTLSEQLAQKLEAQFRRKGRLLLFPEIYINGDDCKRNQRCNMDMFLLKAGGKMLENFGKTIMSADPDTDGRFDKEISLVAGILYELGPMTQFRLNPNPEMAARWYQRSLKQSTCSDAGAVQAYPCEKLDVVAKSRLAFLCISGQACTDNLSANKRESINKGIEILQPMVAQVEAWYRNGANPNDIVLNGVHNFAIFLPSDIQLKIGLVRAETIRSIFSDAGAVRPHPDWRNLASQKAVSGNDVICAPKDADIPGLKNLLPRNPVFNLGNFWPNWFELAANSGGKDAINIRNDIASESWNQREENQLKTLSAKWERDMADGMKSWRKRIQPKMTVRVPQGDKISVAKISGTKVISERIPIIECVSGVHHYRRGLWDRTDCTEERITGYNTITEDISKILPTGYDANGQPINAGGSLWVGNQQKSVDGQLIEVPDDSDCEAKRKVQALWMKKYK